MDFYDRMKSGEKILIGMVHMLPLPGTFRSGFTIDDVLKRAVSDAEALESSGYDALIVENEDEATDTHLSKVQFAGFSMAAKAVKNAVSIPVGLCCGCLNYEEALSIAKVAGCSFVRLPIFVDTVMNYNGIITPCSSRIINYRKMIGAEDIRIFADVQVKHYVMVDPSVSIATSTRWACRQGADAVIVSGADSGLETSSSQLEEAKKVSRVPVVVGSGITEANIKEKLGLADGFIVGTSIRENGKLALPIDKEKAARLVREVSEAR